MASVVVTFKIDARQAGGAARGAGWRGRRRGACRPGAGRAGRGAAPRYCADLVPDQGRAARGAVVGRRRAGCGQIMAAGVDHVPLQHLPPQLPVAGNGGASAESISSISLRWPSPRRSGCSSSMANLKAGQFNQFVARGRWPAACAASSASAGIGVATARRMRALGLKGAWQSTGAVRRMSRSTGSDPTAGLEGADAGRRGTCW